MRETGRRRNLAMILVLAGRRIDAVNAPEARFPLQNVAKVQEALRAFLKQEGATALVSSAACGADIIALQEAGKLGLRRRVVLPFDRGKFRQKSVDDRPGNWGPLFETNLDEIEQWGDLVTVKTVGISDPYSAVSTSLLDEAVRLGNDDNEPIEAVVVWDGRKGEEPDYTAEFADEARNRGLKVKEILTL